MNCQDINQVIYDYCDGKISSDLYLEISQHLNECESCYNNYRLTLIENEVLKDTEDIPSLSPAFTQLVISSLISNKCLYSKPAPLVIRKDKSYTFFGAAWFRSLAVVAAVIALCLYIPRWPGTDIKNVANNYDSAKQQETQSSASLNEPIRVGQVDPEVISQPTQQIKSPIYNSDNKIIREPFGEGFASRSSISSSPTSKVIPPPLQDAEVVMFADNTKSNTSVTVVSPQNIPDRFKLLKTDNDGQNKIAYNYTTLDGRDNLDIVVITAKGSTVASDNLEIPPQLDTTSLVRHIEIGNIKITVTFSGTLSTEDLNILADTIQFKAEDTK